MSLDRDHVIANPLQQWCPDITQTGSSFNVKLTPPGALCFPQLSRWRAHEASTCDPVSLRFPLPAAAGLFMERTNWVIRSLYQSQPSQCQPMLLSDVLGELRPVSRIQFTYESWKKNWLHASLYIPSQFNMTLVMHQMLARLDVCCANTACPEL